MNLYDYLGKDIYKLKAENERLVKELDASNKLHEQCASELWDLKETLRNLVEIPMPKPNRFDYVAYDASAQSLQADFKEAFTGIAQGIEILGDNRSTALALIKLEECYMWVGKAIRDDQIARNGEAELQEGRNNS